MKRLDKIIDFFDKLEDRICNVEKGIGQVKQVKEIKEMFDNVRVIYQDLKKDFSEKDMRDMFAGFDPLFHEGNIEEVLEQIENDKDGVLLKKWSDKLKRINYLLENNRTVSYTHLRAHET